MTAANQSGNLTGEMHIVDRLRHSKGAKITKGSRPLIDACHAHGTNLRALAAKLRMVTGHKKISHSHLSQAANGALPIDLAVAKKIEELTGYQATVANWPKLRSE